MGKDLPWPRAALSSRLAADRVAEGRGARQLAQGFLISVSSAKLQLVHNAFLPFPAASKTKSMSQKRSLPPSVRNVLPATRNTVAGS